MVTIKTRSADFIIKIVCLGICVVAIILGIIIGISKSINKDKTPKDTTTSTTNTNVSEYTESEIKEIESWWSSAGDNVVNEGDKPIVSK